MLTNWITKMDFNILNLIQDNFKCAFLDKMMPIISFIGAKGWFFILVGILFLCIPKIRIWGASLLSSLGLGLVFGNLLIKNIVGRVRPYDVMENITLLVDKLEDFSFPSGHTLAAFEFCTVLCFMPINKIYKVIAVLFAFMMGFSRLYLYVHYPSDVFAGMLLGILFGIMGVRIVSMIVEEKKAKKALQNKDENSKSQDEE